MAGPDNTAHQKENSIQPASPRLSRATELQNLLELVLQQIIPFAAAADVDVQSHKSHSPTPHPSLITKPLSPSQLTALLKQTSFLNFSNTPPGSLSSFQSDIHTILTHSVNTLSPGFMDKLYSAPLPPAIAADLLLSILNTNVHVYQVSPILTLIEKSVTKHLASLFGLTGPRAGGINVQGGSASNLTSLIVARNTLYPLTKLYGNAVDGLDLVLFTSVHGHYSIEKAALACGFGSQSCIPVPVSPSTGAMDPPALEALILQSIAQGKTPFYVNATAGTTVLGSFDPFLEISRIAKRYNMWMHVDGAWGGSFVFSDKLRERRLKGVEEADSVAVNAHKMMGVPVTCSFLLVSDLRGLHEANRMEAGYLFHDREGDEAFERNEDFTNGSGIEGKEEEKEWKEPNDLADLTLQCGRRGDSLKLFMAWRYYGTEGFRQKIENAYDVACHMANIVAKRRDFILVSQNPLPCLQVCFYYAPGGKLLFGEGSAQAQPPGLSEAVDQESMLEKFNSKVTERTTRALVRRGFMIDFAPPLEGEVWKGKFFRAVVNISTPRETVERLVGDVEELGKGIVGNLREQFGAKRRNGI